MIDLSKIKIEQDKDIIHPVKIFASLPNKSVKYNGYLRNVQSEVLNKWFQARDNKENIIKMNTGSGKTTISLLILQSCLNEKKGNAVYVVPDNYLIDQVLSEAVDLGIKATKDVNDVDFIRNKAILVISIQRLVNGKTIFNRKKISNILIDDVHACLEIAANQFKIVVDRSDYKLLYNEILNLFKNDLQIQNYFNYLNIEEGIPTSTSMLVPFWSVQEKYKELMQIINMHRQDENFINIEFPLDLIGNIIDMCNVVVSYDQIEITPDSVPIQKISGFDNALRRIYVSATLKDDGDLIKNFNLDINSVEQVITPDDALDIGNRIILFPQLNNPKINDEDIKMVLKQKSKDIRVVVIVPSKRRAEFWEDVADRIFDKNNIDNIKEYNSGLDVVINRYNGIDLKDDLCRILVIDGLPNARTKYDEIKEMMLLDTNTSIKEQMQKIEQGMGRGIRSNQDYCAIVFMQKPLSNIIYSEGAIENFGISTQKQFELSESFYDELKGKSVEEILENMNLCIERNPQWLGLSNEILSDLKYDNNINYDDRDIVLHNAFQYALDRNFRKCVQEIQKNINNETDLRLRGYYKMLLAKYMNFYDRTESQNILKSAKEDNSFVLIPISGYVYKKNKSKVSSQSNQIIEYIKNNNMNVKDYCLKLNTIVNNLIFAPKTFDKFEQAMCEVGNCIGFLGELPERKSGNGPDVLWIINNNTAFVIECKNEAITDEINKLDCGQLLNSINWAEKNYPKLDVIGIVVHRANKFSKNATPSKNVMILSKEGVELLANNIRNFASSIEALNFELLNESTISQCLVDNRLTESDFKTKYFIKK